MQNNKKEFLGEKELKRMTKKERKRNIYRKINSILRRFSPRTAPIFIRGDES